MSTITRGQRTFYRYELRDDIDAGFRESVENNQVSLALNYALRVIERQQSAIDELKEQVEGLESKKTTSSRRSSSKSKQSDDGDE